MKGHQEVQLAKSDCEMRGRDCHRLKDLKRYLQNAGHGSCLDPDLNKPTVKRHLEQPGKLGERLGINNIKELLTF